MKATLTGDAGAEGRRGEITVIGMPVRNVIGLFKDLTTEII